MSATATRTMISLETDCGFDACTEFSAPLYGQLRTGYDVCSVMPIPELMTDWRVEHRTARKRANKCRMDGYKFRMVKRDQRAAEVYEINTSKPVRQKRPMTDGYSRMPSSDPDRHYPCRRHGIHAYGVEDSEGTLVAYLWLYRAGQLALVSQILGHADHLDNGIMYLLWEGMVTLESCDPDGFIVYNRHDSGTAGLRFYKERVGLQGMEVEWRP